MVALGFRPLGNSLDTVSGKRSSVQRMKREAEEQATEPLGGLPTHTLKMYIKGCATPYSS